MRIYIAGPYSRGDVGENINNAIKAANRIWEKGHIPYIPHLTHFWHLITPKPYETWLDYDLYWLKQCDAVLRLPGESAGADQEVREAQRLNMPVYYDEALIELE